MAPVDECGWSEHDRGGQESRQSFLSLEEHGVGPRSRDRHRVGFREKAAIGRAFDHLGQRGITSGTGSGELLGVGAFERSQATRLASTLQTRGRPSSQCGALLSAMSLAREGV
jgi:hypothetical protein